MILAFTQLIQASPSPDTTKTKFDRAIHGRPFDLDEMLGTPVKSALPNLVNGVPRWVLEDEIRGDAVYYGIGKSTKSIDEADNDARLRFSQFVEVSVKSIATQQIEENKDRLVENYSYESLVSTNMKLRSVKISERYMTSDSIYHSLIKYGKSEYHKLVTDEIKISLETDIRKQELAHQATEALHADSLRHKLTMDSLALGRKQAVIDSLDHILKMEESRIRQEQERIDLIKSRFAAFLKLKPRFLMIDVPSASTPRTWIHSSGRWDPNTGHMRQVKLGTSLWLFTAEAGIWGVESLANQADLSIKLEVLPPSGDIYPVQLALGYIKYVTATEGGYFDLRKPGDYGSLSPLQTAEWRDSPIQGTSFFAVGTVGVPTINSHINIYLDNRMVSLGSIWYPFPRNMGDAISIINQIDYIKDESYQNRFGDPLQWQIGLRLIAISDRFATMVSYEDHEAWMLNFEFQY